jgi:hypothetical protein
MSSSSSSSSSSASDESSAAAAAGAEFEVEAVVAAAWDNGFGVEPSHYRVKWVGSSKKTWQPAETVKHLYLVPKFYNSAEYARQLDAAQQKAVSAQRRRRASMKLPPNVWPKKLITATPAHLMAILKRKAAAAEARAPAAATSDNDSFDENAPLTALVAKRPKLAAAASSSAPAAAAASAGNHSSAGFGAGAAATSVIADSLSTERANRLKREQRLQAKGIRARENIQSEVDELMDLCDERDEVIRELEKRLDASVVHSRELEARLALVDDNASLKSAAKPDA